MDPVIAEINELCKTARHYRWADRTDKLYHVRSTKDIQAGVEKARGELLNRDGSIKDQYLM